MPRTWRHLLLAIEVNEFEGGVLCELLPLPGTEAVL